MQKKKKKIMKLRNFRGELTHVLAKKEPLCSMQGELDTWHSTWWCTNRYTVRYSRDRTQHAPFVLV